MTIKLIYLAKYIATSQGKSPTATRTLTTTRKKQRRGPDWLAPEKARATAAMRRKAEATRCDSGMLCMLANGDRMMELWGRKKRKLRRGHVGSRRKRTEIPAGAMTRADRGSDGTMS